VSRSRLAVGAAAGFCLVPASAPAAERPVQVVELPPAATLLRAPPPLNPPRRAPTRPVLPIGGARVSARQVVMVSATPSGALQAIRVVHRLDVRGTGDYTFAVPAPVLEVAPAPASESVPGRRENEIVWKGFVPGRKVLAATASLRVAEAAPAVPLRVAILGPPTRPGPFSLEIVIADATRTQASTFSADAVAADVAAALDALARAAARDEPDPERRVRIHGSPSPSSTDGVTAAFDLAGTLRFPVGAVRDLTPVAGGATVEKGSVRFSMPIGGTRPGVVRVRLRGVALRPATPELRVTATPAPAAALPRPPAASWTAAVRQGRLRTSGRRLLETAFRAKLGYERTRQYQAFLGSPAGPNVLRGPLGPSRTTYVFRTVAAVLATPTARPSRGEPEGVAVPLLLVVGGTLLAGAGLVVLWAHL
jgi:hypothetical protein